MMVSQSAAWIRLTNSAGVTAFPESRGSICTASSVVEAITNWPEEYDDWEPADRQRFEQRLHAEPAQAAQLEYVRMHTGFQRQITVGVRCLLRLLDKGVEQHHPLKAWSSTIR